MKQVNVFLRILHFYRDGFRAMTLGKTLWWIILIKLFIMFAVLKVFFFPNFLGKMKNPAEKQEYIENELIKRAVNS